MNTAHHNNSANTSRTPRDERHRRARLGTQYRHPKNRTVLRYHSQLPPMDTLDDNTTAHPEMASNLKYRRGTQHPVLDPDTAKAPFVGHASTAQ